jgi:hypothetical protein
MYDARTATAAEDMKSRRPYVDVNITDGATDGSEL